MEEPVPPLLSAGLPALAAWWAGGCPRPQPSQPGRRLSDGGEEEGEGGRLEDFAPGNKNRAGA